MTVKEYKHMIFMECGLQLTAAQARIHMAIEAEHEAEAIAGGKYDVDPAIEQERLAKIAAAKPFRVMIEMPRYCIHTDGLIGSSRWVAGGYDTREQAVTARATMYMPDEASSWIEPREPITHPMANVADLDECPF